MHATAPREQVTSAFLVQTLCHLWSAKGWQTGCSTRPHARTLTTADVWMQPPGRSDVALFIHMHGADEVEAARNAVALTAASSVEGFPRWIGCVHVFDVRDGAEELGQVARLGHAMACELSSFLYHASTWQCADHMVELARAVEGTGDRLIQLAGVR